MRKALRGFAFPLAKDVLPKLQSKATLSILYKFEKKKINRKGVLIGKFSFVNSGLKIH